MYARQKPIAAVCHAPVVFRDVLTSAGDPLVQDKQVTCFSNSEEEAVGLTDVVPELVEDMLMERGGQYTKADDWQSHVVVDGVLITGQNHDSSQGTADE